MTLLATTAALLAISGALGYAVFLALRPTSHRWIRFVAPIVPGIVILFLAGIAFLVVGDAPASDEQVGSSRRVSVDVRLPSQAGKIDEESVPDVDRPARNARQLRRPVDGKLLGTIAVDAPSSVAVRQDFTLSVTVSSTQPTAIAGVRSVRLLAPPSADLRTLDTCDDAAGKATTACATVTDGQLHVSWDVTPTEPGEMLFTVQLPADVMPQHNVGAWIVSVELRGSGGSGTQNLASHGQPVFTVNDVSMNLRQQQLRVVVTVVSTLGVSRSTYNAIAVTGTLLSAVLGSGWLWQLLAWWRSRGVRAEVS